MDKTQELNTYISNMKIKKTLFGGYDREDVYVKIGKIVELFQQSLDEMEKEKAKLEEGYEKRLEASEMLIAELNKKIGGLTIEQKNAIQEKEKMKEFYKEYCSNILQQYSDSLRTLSAEFTQVLDNVTNLQKNIVDADFFEKVESGIVDVEKIESTVSAGNVESIECVESVESVEDVKSTENVEDIRCAENTEE